MAEEFSFEKALKRLEEIVGEIEGETLELAKSMALYEEGKKLIAQLEKALAAAEKKLSGEDKKANT